jgi:SAM-dependent methyltransferase
LCQALERHRFLALLLRRLAPVIGSSAALLDVAPQPQVRRVLKDLVADGYVGLDLLPGREITVFGDLTKLPFQDGSFDVIMCYHVLEHIPDDRGAMRELARVLAPGGLALVQVPRRPNAMTVENPAADEEERIRRFGQADHVRYYGRDFETRLVDNGLRPAVFQPGEVLTEEERARFSIPANGPVWVCRQGRSRDAATPDFRLRGTRPTSSPPLPQQAPPVSAEQLRASDIAALKRLIKAHPLGGRIVAARRRLRHGRLRRS